MRLLGLKDLPPRSCSIDLGVSPPDSTRMGSWLFHYVIVLRFGRPPTAHESLDVHLLGWTSSKKIKKEDS